jgi:RsiW-degrading membrane proteinase PrsW (M82 family)
VSNLVQYARLVNNLPGEPQRKPLAKRILTSKWTWILLAAVIVYTLCLVLFFDMIMGEDQVVPGGVILGINATAVKRAAWAAAPTLAFWVLVFLIVDRFRPQKPLLWFLALGWGASVAVILSIEINSWAAAHMNVYGDGDPTQNPRPAIFVAPFVEEATKATVIFLLAILVRYRLVSRLSLVSLAGLSAAGFAFVENILYYARVMVYSTRNINVGDVESAISYIVWLRGFWTCFGHPLFTMMTAIGVAVAIRARSKVVRIIAPLAGYLFAVGGHMLFNSQSSVGGDGTTESLYPLYFGVAIPLVLAAVIYMVRQVLAQGRLIRSRLADYVRVGWLAESDPLVFSRLRTRFYAAFIALTKGWSVWLATVELQGAMTELAYLRDAETNGIIDGSANIRAEELLWKIRKLRPNAISNPRGMRITWPKLRLKKRALKTKSGNWPTEIEANGSIAGYSAVDPKWGPPQG